MAHLPKLIILWTVADFSLGIRILNWDETLLINFVVIHEGPEAPENAQPKFNAFSGVGRRLDGKPMKYQPSPVSSSGSNDKRPEVSSGAQPSAGSSSQGASRQSQGKLVFGSNQNRTRETRKVCLSVCLSLS